MALLTLRDEKGIPLTHQEMDANLRNLNAEGVTGGNAHDHTTGNGAPIPYNSLTGKPTLGTAATANVTTSATDTTAGRLLKVGDFGVGGMLDLRGTIYETGTPSDVFGKGTVVGFANATSLGLPIGGYGTLTISSHWIDISGYAAHNRMFQYGDRLFLQYATTSTTWGPWNEVYSQGSILGTVSQSSGVPTGAVIERGSNANGQYTKFADGTLICFIHYIGLTGTVTAGNYNTMGTVFFPAVFVGLPAVSCQIGGWMHGASSYTIISVEDLTESYFAPVILSSASYTGYNGVRVFAVGRWF